MSQNARSKYPTSSPVIAVAGIAVNDQKEVLLIQRANPPSKGFWTFPGGKVEWGETLIEGLKREVKEETGLSIKNPKLLTTYEIIDSFHFVILDYVVEVDNGITTAGDDALDCKWIAIEELNNIPVTKGVIEILRKAGY